jgi:hypothetical protein
MFHAQKPQRVVGLYVLASAGIAVAYADDGRGGRFQSQRQGTA